MTKSFIWRGFFYWMKFQIERRFNMYSFSMAVKRLLDLLTFADFRKPKRFGIFRHLYQYESDNENFHIMANMVLTGIASIWLVKYHGDKIIIGTDGVPRFRLKKSKK